MNASPQRNSTLRARLRWIVVEARLIRTGARAVVWCPHSHAALSQGPARAGGRRLRGAAVGRAIAKLEVLPRIGRRFGRPQSVGACADQGHSAQDTQDVWHTQRHNPCVRVE